MVNYFGKVAIMRISTPLVGKRYFALALIPFLVAVYAVQRPQSALVPAASTLRTTSSSTPTPAAVVSSSLGNISWLMPGSWRVVRPRSWTAPVGPLLFLSNARIIDPCASSYRGTECLKPVTKLPPGAILVTFGGLGINACLRAPNFATNQTLFQRMMSSLKKS